MTGYLLPDRPETLFIWQTATKPRHGVPRLGIDLMLYAIRKAVTDGVTEIQATVDRSNTPIVMLFKTVARELGGQIGFSHFCDGSLLASAAEEGHHDETRITIDLEAS